MSWCKFDDRADGEKMALASAVPGVGDAAIAFWFRAVLHCSRNRTDGFVDARLISRLTMHRKPLAVVDALVAAKVRPDGVGLLVPCEGGWMVHDYLKFNRSRAEAEADEAEAEAERAASRERMRVVREARRSQHVRSDTERTQTEQPPNVRRDTDRTTAERSESVRESFALSSRAPERAARDPVPSRPVPTPEEQKSAGEPAPAAAPPLSELGEKILAAAAKLPRVGPLVDAAYANELALIADRCGKAALVGKALDEADGKLAAQGGPVDVGQGRDVIQKFIRNALPDRVPAQRGAPPLQPPAGKSWKSTAHDPLAPKVPAQ
jgi:hypothetical protein